MAFLQRALRALSGRSVPTNIEKRSILDVPGNLWNPAIIAQVMQGGSSQNSSNEWVNDFTAQSIGCVYTCNKILCDQIASLPCKLYKSAGTGEKQLALDDPLYRILTLEFNPETSAFAGMAAIVMHLNFRGNAYVEVVRDPISGKVVSLWNLDPRRTEPVRLTEQANQLAYKTSDGMNSGTFRYVLAKNMLHFSINTWGGIVGQSPVACLRESMGLAISQQKFMGRTMTNSAVPSVVIKMDGLGLSPTDKVKAKEEWEALYSGANQRRAAILDPGMSVEPLSLNSVDMELLASRKFTRDELAAAYGIPSWMVGDTEKLTSASAVQLALAFVQNTIAPLCKLLETEMKRKLVPANSTAHIAFDLRERLRGDFNSTLQAYSVGLQNGFYTRNEVRRELGEDPVGPEGDVLTAQVNMTSLQQIARGAQEVTDGTSAEYEAEQDDNADTPSLRSMKAAYLPLFRNAVTRSLTGGDNIMSAFGPVLESMLEVRATSISTDDTAALLTDMLGKIERRSRKWEAAQVEQHATDELERGIRSIVFAVHDAAARKELSA